MKATETIYKGYRFRSRLEARWAVFFDALGTEYEYEAQGYQLRNGLYLPDFFLWQPETFVEVKPAPCPASGPYNSNDEIPIEQRLISDLVYDTKKSGAVVYGDPIDAFSNDFQGVYALSANRSAHYCDLFGIFDPITFAEAATKSRQARFEHGEHGA